MASGLSIKKKEYVVYEREREREGMKRRGGDGGRTLDMKDEETSTMKERGEMEDLCSRLVSLIPQDYLLLETTSQQVL